MAGWTVFLSAVILIIDSNAETNVLDSPRGSMNLNDDSLDVSCNSLDLITDIFTPLETRTYFENVNVAGCLLPAKTLLETFHHLNIDAAKMRSLKIKDSHIEGYKDNFTAGLKIKTFEFHIDQEDANTNNLLQALIPLLMPSSGVTNLNVSGVELPALPSQLEVLEVNSASVKNWENCKHLLELTITGRHLHEPVFPDTWPSDCSLIETIRLIELEKSSAQLVAMNLIKNSPKLKSLTVRSCHLIEFPLDGLPDQLEHLDLGDNDLDDQDFIQFPVLRYLETLDLSKNNLNGIFISQLVQKLPALKNLILNSNTLLQYEELSLLTSFASLERLSMNNLPLSLGFYRGVHFQALKYLSFASEDPIEKLWLNNFPSTNASELTVDLRGRFISSVPVRLAHFSQKGKEDPSLPWFLKSNTKLSILASYVDCDCNNGALAKILRTHANILSFSGAKCNNKDGKEIITEPLEKMACNKIDCTHVDCICKEKKSWIDSTSIFDCSYQMKEYFDWKTIVGKAKLKGINVAGNLLTKPPAMNGLDWLDLRNNHISRLTPEETARLFSPRMRRVWLGGNPITCECNNKVLLDAILSNKTKIMDFKELVCIETGERLHELSTTKLCRKVPKVMDFVWGICCAGSALSVFVMLFIRRYGRSLKIILYSRGWCGSCLKPDVDADRPYDAFISFAHGDEKFVMEELIPKLEDGPDQFKVCVHYRDWQVGEWIPAQIMNSVRASKRTVIVLSRNFVESWWGVLEFRYAHASAMAEGKSRLIVLIVDDVLTEKLAPEMQGYLEYHTFLRCDDPWFWDKLRFGMPRSDGDAFGHTNYSMNLSTHSLNSQKKIAGDALTNFSVNLSAHSLNSQRNIAF